MLLSLGREIDAAQLGLRLGAALSNATAPSLRLPSGADVLFLIRLGVRGVVFVVWCGVVCCVCCVCVCVSVCVCV